MTDIISRQAAIDAAMKVIERDTSGKNVVVEAMEAWKVYIMRLPSAVDPVKHGKWEKISVRNYKCSCCNAWWSVDRRSTMKDFYYCPHCGATMDKGEVE